MNIINNYSNLQEYFESLPTDEIKKIHSYIEKIGQDDDFAFGPELWQIICSIWLRETGEEHDIDTISDEKLETLFRDMKWTSALYLNVRSGDMSFTGKILLSDAKAATFRITEQGIANAKKLLAKLQS